MRVLHLIDGIGVGGAELVLIQLIERLEKAGVRNTILSLTPAGIVRDRVVASGADLIEMNMGKGRLPWSNMSGLLGVMRTVKPDVIQGWMYHGNFAATVLRDLSALRVPMFWSIHNTLLPRLPFSRVTRIAYQACRLMSFRPRSIVYVSRAAAEQHEAEGYRAARTVIIPNGTDCERFKPSPVGRQNMRASLGVGEDVLLLGCFARWAPMKGHSVLFEALSKLRGRGIGLHLVMAGTLMQQSNADLLALMRQAGIEDICTCLGERRDVDHLMTGLDALVLPSIYGEAFPMVLGEAMACEVPCVATDVGDSAFLLGDTGFVVPPSDVAAFAAALAALAAESPEQRASRGKAARRRVASLFSIDTMTSAYLDMYQPTLRTVAPAEANGLG